MRQRRPACAVILSGVLWGVIGIFIKTLSAAGISPMQITCIRMVVAAPIFFAVVFLTDRAELRIRLRDCWMFLGTGVVSVVLFNGFYFYTMVHSQASIAVVLLYTSPIFIMLLSALLFRERITPRKLAALGLTFVGCVLVAGVLGSGYALPPRILLTGLLAGFFYGLYTIFGKFALKRYDAVTVTVYTFLFGAVGVLPVGGVTGIVRTVRQTPTLLWWCLGIGVLCVVLPYYLYTYGLQRMESGKAAILVAVEPLVGAVIGMTLFHESRDLLKLLGIASILAAILLLNLPDRKTENRIGNDP